MITTSKTLFIGKGRLSLRSLTARPVRLSARTSPFHGGKTGSIPVPATKERLSLNPHIRQ